MIENHPLGLNQLIEERGSNLSGGQKQRMAVARRALLKKQTFYILYEITSGMDESLECDIVSNIINAINGTIIFITHSSNVYEKCKRTVRIDKGIIKV